MAEAKENKKKESKKSFKIILPFKGKGEKNVTVETDNEKIIEAFRKKFAQRKNGDDFYANDYCKYYENKIEIDASFFAEKKKVQDVWRYNIKKNKRSNHFELWNSENNRKISEDNQYTDKPATEAKGNVCLLIIESPHKDEYDENFNPIAPAQGKTGKNIENYFCEIINSLDESIKRVFCKKIKKKDNQNKQESYEVMQLIICNPVQFQASLYELHQSENSWDYSNFKDSIWRKLYNNDIGKERSFINRVNKTYKPKIIINACTYNVGKVVDAKIKKMQEHFYLKASSHPSVWGFPVFELVEIREKLK